MNITRYIKGLTFSLLIMVVALAAACAVPQNTTTRTPVAVPPSKPVEPSTSTVTASTIAPLTPVSGLENTNWFLQSYGQPGNLRPVLPDASITALFDSKNGQLGGSSGVNRYSGGYELKNGKLLLATPLASTMMAGPQPLMDQEQEYLTAIQAVESYQVKDGILQLNCGKQILVFTKELSKGLSVDITSSGQEVSLAAGETLTVTLESNATTGYSWNENASIGDKTVIQQADHKYQPPAAAIPGAGGKEVWHFQSLKTGTSKISMEYRRPFEPNAAPAKTFTLAVIVN